MKTYICRAALLVSLLLGNLLSACSVFGGASGLKPPEGSSSERIPLYSQAETISLDEADRSSFIVDILGREYILYASSTDISWTEDIGDKVKQNLDESLPDDKWRLTDDWYELGQYSFSRWKKGDLELNVVVFDNLDSSLTNDLKRGYGISGPVPGSTLIVIHVIDTTQPLPDLTATADTEKYSASATAEYQAWQATSTAEYFAYQAFATESAATAIAQATQTAQATSDAAVRLLQELQRFSDEFNSTQLSTFWDVYRPDPQKWDLTSQPGALHIVGSPSRDAGILNIFGARVAYSDMEVTTKVASPNMTNDGQSIWIAFTPDDYSSDNQGYTVELGLAFDNYDGYLIYMWACNNESCYPDRVGTEEITYTGSVYLKLVRQGLDYFGYYSLDGNQWTYVGEHRNFTVITDQVTLGAGGGGEDFDAYFDFIRYSVPGQ